jgi:microcystin-dependent protein
MRLEDVVILGASDKYPAGTTGGEAEHTLTVGENDLTKAGGSQPHNNMMPYYAAYMWEKIA